MIQCEHFIYALMQDGYQLIESPKLYKYIDSGRLTNLLSFAEAMQEGIGQVWFPEGLIAVIFKQNQQDKYKRNGTWLHVIIIKVQDYLELTQPAHLFSKHFIRNSKELPQRLDPIQIGE